MAQKSLDVKLERILADPSCKDFIIADAKDADMAFGITARGSTRPGRSPIVHFDRQLPIESCTKWQELFRASRFTP